MTPLRQRMIEDMQVRNLSPHTQSTYVLQVSLFARYFGKPPDQLGPEEIRSYQVYLTKEKKLATGSILIAVAALRFLYKITLHQDWTLPDIIPAPKKPQKLPVVLSPEEVRHFLSCVASPKHRTILTTCYAAGLRVSEAVRLRPPEIDSQRMVIRVDQGKGQKDRYVMLSPRLLEILREWWRLEKPKGWLFPGQIPGRHITRFAVEQACQQALQSSHIPKPITPHSGTRSRFISSNQEPTCAVSNCCLVIAAWRQPPAIFASPPAKCVRLPAPSICSRSQRPLNRLPLHLSISEPGGRWSVRSSKWPKSSVAMVRLTGRTMLVLSHAGSGA